MVPKKGLEPPHPCEYVDLNHARLPIPPLRHDLLLAVIPSKAAYPILLSQASMSNLAAKNSPSARKLNLNLKTNPLTSNVRMAKPV